MLDCPAWRAFAERTVYENIDLDSHTIKPALESDDHLRAYVRRTVLSILPEHDHRPSTTYHAHAPAEPRDLTVASPTRRRAYSLRVHHRGGIVTGSEAPWLVEQDRCHLYFAVMPIPCAVTAMQWELGELWRCGGG